MYFDDRLATVMGQPAQGAHERAVRWRQLVELVARAQDESSLLQAALAMLRAERPSIPSDVRAAALRAVAGRAMLPVVFAALVADEDRATATMMIAAAPFDDQAWARIATLGGPVLADRIATLHGPVAPFPAVRADAPVELPLTAHPAAPEPSAAPTMPSIDDMLSRIERLRSGLLGTARDHDRDIEEVAPSPPPSQSADVMASATIPSLPAQPAAPTVDDRLFRWECDASGEVAWVQGIPRAALVGFNLSRDESGDYVSPALGQAFARRSPFQDAPLVLPGEGGGAGRWDLSGTPLFEPVEGRFLGYRGIARRPDAAPPTPRAADIPATTVRTVAAPSLPDSVSLRELVHEIRTPLNAIIGFAEIIDGQYLGPAHRRYRERAADIVVQARTLLAALEDLDLAARLQSGQATGGQGEEPADLGRVVPALLSDLAARAAREQVELEVGHVGQFACPLQADLVDRLIRRFIAAVIDEAEPGERLRVATTRRNEHCWLVIDRPRRTHGLASAELLDPAFGSGGARDAGADESGDEDGDGALLPTAGRRLGLGFQLRLVRGLARLAGGDLEVDAEGLVLVLPIAGDA